MKKVVDDSGPRRKTEAGMVLSENIPLDRPRLLAWPPGPLPAGNIAPSRQEAESRVLRRFLLALKTGSEHGISNRVFRFVAG